MILVNTFINLLSCSATPE